MPITDILTKNTIFANLYISECNCCGVYLGSEIWCFYIYFYYTVILNFNGEYIYAI